MAAAATAPAAQINRGRLAACFAIVPAAHPAARLALHSAHTLSASNKFKWGLLVEQKLPELQMNVFSKCMQLQHAVTAQTMLWS